jgi:two-component system response regulator
MSDALILLVDDDDDDRLLVQRALDESATPSRLCTLKDGSELLAYLSGHDPSRPPNAPCRPDLILLDLNMPQMDGRQALKRLKEADGLQGIPVIVFTTSDAGEEMRECYELGCASYIRKPTSFAGMVDVMKTLVHHWLGEVETRQK